jgi:maleylacetate reductase
LTVALPSGVSVVSALNAIAHAAEGLYAADANPVTGLMAVEGISALARAIPVIRSCPTDLEARGDALYGAWLCGTVLGSVSMGLHHKLCHTLGGSFNLPHAETHAIMLSHSLAYNAVAAPEAMARIAAALGAANAPRAVYDLTLGNGAPTALKELGLPAQDLDLAADIAVRDQYPNPRPLEKHAIRRLLGNAYDGRPPEPS